MVYSIIQFLFEKEILFSFGPASQPAWPVFLVMSGMDPHMISGTWDMHLVKSFVGLRRSAFTRLWVGHGET
jgi:hypothetical protein